MKKRVKKSEEEQEFIYIKKGNSFIKHNVIKENNHIKNVIKESITKPITQPKLRFLNFRQIYLVYIPYVF